MNLPEQKIDAGRALIQKLDAARPLIDVVGAFWYEQPESDLWKLGIAARQEASPRSFYARIQKLIDAEIEKGIVLDELVLMKPDAPLLKLLRTAVRTGRSISKIRFVGNSVNGVLLPDMLIYRVL